MKIVRIATREAILKRKLRAHLRTLGFVKSPTGELELEENNKETIRKLHSVQRKEKLKSHRQFIIDKAPELLQYFANGKDIEPEKISPVIEAVSADSWQSDLFRLASLIWSVPVSNGFGRRMRYLVWDNHNKKLIGLIAIGDPVFNLSVRDKLIGWNGKDRTARLVNIMDAYVLGAVPPYNFLLGGKMLACLLKSRDIYEDFTKKYGLTKGIISHQEKRARLLAITTTSSMGRSSVYNRLKIEDTEFLKSIGFTGGWGHFHIPDNLFQDLRNYIRDKSTSYADKHKFGEGPNWRMRATREALSTLNFKQDMLKHGIQREVFITPLAENAFKILKTGKGRPNISKLKYVEEIGNLAVKRWMIPRSQTRKEYESWKIKDILDLLSSESKTVRTKVLQKMNKAKR